MSQPTKQQRQAISQIVTFCRDEVLFLNKWTIHVNYKKATSKVGPNGCIYADIDCDTKYFEAWINVYPDLLQQTHDIVFSTILHELCHLVTEEQQELLNKVIKNEFINSEMVERANERETSTLQVIVESLLRHPVGPKTYSEIVSKLSKVFD